MNYNIVYIAGGSLYNAKRRHLGYMEMVDMRLPDSNTMIDDGRNWYSHGIYDILGTLELRNSGDVFNDWTLRTGLVI